MRTMPARPVSYASARGRGHAARLLVGATALAFVTTGVLEILGRDAIARVNAQHGQPADTAFVLVFAVVALAQLALFVASAVAVCMWQHRTVRNMPVLGIPGPGSPARAVWAWFIPLVNLILPYYAVRELHDELAGGGGSVGAWWFAYVIGSVLAGVTSQKPLAGSDAGLALSAASAVLLAAAGVLFVRIIGAIQDGADARAAAASQAPAAPTSVASGTR